MDTQKQNLNTQIHTSSLGGEQTSAGGMSTTVKAIIAVVVIVLLALGGYVAYKKYAKKPTPQQQAVSIINKLKKITMLPGGEDPAVLNIEDINKLLEQSPFFTGAQNGDVLVIYPKAAKAIVYSPKRNILVNMGPLTYQPTAPAAVPLDQAQNPATKKTK